MNQLDRCLVPGGDDAGVAERRVGDTDQGSPIVARVGSTVEPLQRPSTMEHPVIVCRQGQFVLGRTGVGRIGLNDSDRQGHIERPREFQGLEIAGIRIVQVAQVKRIQLTLNS